MYCCGFSDQVEESLDNTPYLNLAVSDIEVLSIRFLGGGLVPDGKSKTTPVGFEVTCTTW